MNNTLVVDIGFVVVLFFKLLKQCESYSALDLDNIAKMTK
jgi:hypothetical protein